MATKLEERKALGKIKAIIDTLGEDSYVAAAFEGCADLAKENIDNDFMCSPMDWCRKVEQLAAEKDEAIKARDEAVKQLAECQHQIPTSDMVHNTICFLHDISNTYAAEKASAAKLIVELADNPADIAFSTAVARHREMGRLENECEMLIEYYRSL